MLVCVPINNNYDVIVCLQLDCSEVKQPPHTVLIGLSITPRVHT